MNSVIIVAGGKGLRMGTKTPKQFLVLKVRTRAYAYHSCFLQLGQQL